MSEAASDTVLPATSQHQLEEDLGNLLYISINCVVNWEKIHLLRIEISQHIFMQNSSKQNMADPPTVLYLCDRGTSMARDRQGLGREHR